MVKKAQQDKYLPRKDMKLADLEPSAGAKQYDGILMLFMPITLFKSFMTLAFSNTVIYLNYILLLKTFQC